jgi:hypothetical protein
VKGRERMAALPSPSACRTAWWSLNEVAPVAVSRWKSKTVAPFSFPSVP